MWSLVCSTNSSFGESFHGVEGTLLSSGKLRTRIGIRPGNVRRTWMSRGEN